jgi:glycosyltransferase involved in cell wall biosynthesis
MVYESRALTVSIVIPVYNEATLLPACLDAIAAQSVLPDEVIVVDNNSTDTSIEIARHYDFVRIVHERRVGVNYASWRGAQATRSAIVVRIDADTRLAADWVANVQRYFAAHPDIAAVTGKSYFYDFPFPRITSVVHAFFQQYLQHLIAGTTLLWASNMAVRRSVWIAVATEVHVAQPVYEDIDLSLVLHRHGYRIRRTRSLQVGLSMLRGHLTPASFWHYLTPWAFTYRCNRLPVRAACVGMLRLVVMVFLLPVPYIALLDRFNPKHQ